MFCILQILACSSEENECYQKLSQSNFGCMVPCTGVFADVSMRKIAPILIINPNQFEVPDDEERHKLEEIFIQYENYKNHFIENIHFEPMGAYSGPKYNYSK